MSEKLALFQTSFLISGVSSVLGSLWEYFQFSEFPSYTPLLEMATFCSFFPCPVLCKTLQKYSSNTQKQHSSNVPFSIFESIDGFLSALYRIIFLCHGKGVVRRVSFCVKARQHPFPSSFFSVQLLRMNSLMSFCS